MKTKRINTGGGGSGVSDSASSSNSSNYSTAVFNVYLNSFLLITM